ncbi:MAG: hypothetical protein KAH10_01695 [Flavobacteriales bacterium]|nr:hypothetical protein [Flavobacteriales bacterium]
MVLKNNIKLLVLIISVVSFSLYSCGSANNKNEENFIILPKEELTKEQLVHTLITHGYKVDTLEGDDVFTYWRMTNIELTFFKIEVYSQPTNWKLMGKMKYEAYRDRDLEQSVYMEEYVKPGESTFVIEYGWDMLEKFEGDLNKPSNL